jgi:hypothetical protein
MRLTALKGQAERTILEPLRIHRWTATFDTENESGEYLIVSAERAGCQHKVALLYSTATDNKIYKMLAERTEHIFSRVRLTCSTHLPLVSRFL